MKSLFCKSGFFPSKRTGIEVFVFLVFCLAGTAWAQIPDRQQPPQGDEKQIWDLEIQYILYLKKADYEGVLSLWHDSFLGWPGSEPIPITKQDGPVFLKRRYPKPAAWDFRIKPIRMSIRDDMAITYYLMIILVKDSEGNKRSSGIRLTHTWLRTDDGWKILGGMSGR